MTEARQCTVREIYASLSRVRRLGARHRIRRLQKVHCNGPIPVFVVLIPLLIYFGRGLITPVSPIPGNLTHWVAQTGPVTDRSCQVTGHAALCVFLGGGSKIDTAKSYS